MGSLFGGKYNHWGNSFLPITEAYLELGKNLWLSLFAKIVNSWKPLTIFAKLPAVDSDWNSKYVSVLSPYHKVVHRMSAKRFTKSPFL